MSGSDGRREVLAVLASSVEVCRARADDVPALVALLADDPLGSERELVEIEPYRRAFAQARRQGCAVVQLTTDKSRTDAHRFYSGLGFTASHEGFKLQL